MSDKTKSVVDIRDFEGLEVSSDPHDIKPEHATVQVNITSDNLGRMTTRFGWKLAIFEE